MKHPFRYYCLVIILSCMTGPAWSVLHQEEVKYRHGDVDLKGHLFWEDSFEGPRPGIMVMHEWWGINDYVMVRAEMLAEAGYIAFAADMYGNGRDTRHADDAMSWMKQISGNTELWQARAQLGLEQLLAHEKVDKQRTAAIGYCFGGATVMQLAYAGADLDAVVSFHGSLPPASPKQAARIQAKVLVFHGASDGFIPKTRVDSFSKALNDAEVDWEMITYGGAKHGFTNPYADGYDVKGLEYMATADQRSWSRLLSYLESIFDHEGEF